MADRGLSLDGCFGLEKGYGQPTNTYCSKILSSIVSLGTIIKQRLNVHSLDQFCTMSL